MVIVVQVIIIENACTRTCEFMFISMFVCVCVFPLQLLSELSLVLFTVILTLANQKMPILVRVQTLLQVNLLNKRGHNFFNSCHQRLSACAHA